MDGSSVGAVTSYSFSNVTAGHTITASFAINSYAVAATIAGGQGTATPSSQLVNWGAGASVTITPDVGYYIASITDNGNVVPVTDLYIVSPVTADHNVVVTFAGQRSSMQSILNDLIAFRAGVSDKQDGNKLDEAINHLAKALDASLWVDDAHLQVEKGEKVFNENKDTVNQLRNLMKDKNSSISDIVLQDFIDRIVRADRLLAEVAIADAAGGDPKDIDKANDDLGKGDTDMAEGKYNSGIEHYRNAWKHAQKK